MTVIKNLVVLGIIVLKLIEFIKDNRLIEI